MKGDYSTRYITLIGILVLIFEKRAFNKQSINDIVHAFYADVNVCTWYALMLNGTVNSFFSNLAQGHKTMHPESLEPLDPKSNTLPLSICTWCEVVSSLILFYQKCKNSQKGKW